MMKAKRNDYNIGLRSSLTVQSINASSSVAIESSSLSLVLSKDSTLQRGKDGSGA
jgi:hypothetical protein